MNDQTDPQLLRAYTAGKSEAAFSALVHRYVDLVHSAAFRMLGDADAAQDITQNVFVALAQNAQSLADRPTLAGWLHNAARNLAAKSIRSDARRRTREQEAALMNELNSNPAEANWDDIAPHLDEALGELAEIDRDAVLLRYFKNHDLRSIGAILGTSEDAAQKRVSRAVERLREFFARRGVAIGATGLVVVISVNAVQAAPAGLAVSISTIGAGAAGGSFTAVKFLKILTMTKLKIGIITAVVAAGIAIPVVIQHRTQTRLNAANELLRQQIQRNEQLSAENEKLAKGTTAPAAATNDQRPSLELLKLRGEVGQLREESRAATTSITHDMVESRYKNAQELARNGNAPAALKEFLWCFDEGMPRVTGYGGVRDSFLLSEIAKLGENYPPALTALRERRDQALQRMLNSKTDPDAAQDFASINRELLESQNTLAALDQFPAEDPRRQTLASVAFDQLIGAQRYSDAISGRPYESISSQFEMLKGLKERPLPSNITHPEMIRKNQQDYLINSTAASIEALAGAGDLVHAQTLAGRLLAYDSSPATKEIVQQHLARAGQPGLLNNATNP